MRRLLILSLVTLFVNTAVGEPSRSQLVIHSRTQHHRLKVFGISNYPPSVLSPKFVGHTFVNKTMRIGRPAFRHTIKLDILPSSPKSLVPEKYFDKNGLFIMLSKIGTTTQETKPRTRSIQHINMFTNMVTVKPWWKRGKK